jgi:hypothetical protein
MGSHLEASETPAAAFSRDVALVERQAPLPWLQDPRELQDEALRGELVDAYLRSLQGATARPLPPSFGWRGSLAILCLAAAMPLGLVHMGLGLLVMVAGWTLAGSEVVRELVAAADERRVVGVTPERLLNDTVRVTLDRAVARAGPDWFEMRDEERRAHLEGILDALAVPRLQG